MDLTPAFLDRWREHRALTYLDRVREVFDTAAFDEPWLEAARLRAVAEEASATLGHSGHRVDAEAIKAIIDRSETGPGFADVAVVQAYGLAHQAAMAAAEQQAPITPALLESLHAQLLGEGAVAEDGDPRLQALCDWLAAPPAELHPVVVAAVAHVELLRLRRWPDGNARLARLALLLLLVRSGYGYRGLLAPSTHWSDPRRLPAAPVEQLQPEQAQTLPAVEHVVHCLAQSLRDMVSWVRAEEGAGSLQGLLFGFPLQP